MLSRNDRSHAVRASAGFTVVELLVVVTIMGVMFSMLLPSLAQSREVAKGLKCANNQKQIGLALMQYAGDNKAAAPFIKGLQREGWPTWTTVLGPYLGENGVMPGGKTLPVLLCPSSPFTKYYWQAGNPTPSNYGYGTYFNHYPSIDQESPIYVPNNGYTGVLQNTQPPRRMDKIKRPTQLLMTGEVVHCASGGGAPGSWASINIMSITIYNAFFAASHDSYWFGNQYAIGWWNNTVMMVHPSGTWNSLYADGHVAGESRMTMRGKPVGIYTDTW